MSQRDRNRDARDQEQAFDDATVEQLLAGCYQGGGPQVVAVRDVLEEVRALAEGPVPAPSPALAEILRGSVPVDHGPVASGRRKPDGRPARVGGLRAGRHRPGLSVAICAAVLVGIVLAAGSARMLPGSTQALVADVVETVTPFAFPKPAGHEVESSPGRTPETPPPSDGGTASQNSSSQPPAGEPGRNGDRPAAADGRAESRAPNDADGRRLPTTPVTPDRAAPPVPQTRGPSQMVTTTSTTPPPPRAGGFRAELRGVTDAQGAADPDGRGSAVLEANPGRNQLCLALVVSGIGPATSAHLHAGTTAGSGPPVASFTQLTAGTPGGCVRVTDELIKQIRKDPGGFYVDVHTTEFPNGAVRGQLTK